MSLGVDIGIRAHNADALRGIYSTDAALAKLQRRQGIQRRIMLDQRNLLRQELNERRLLNRELFNQSRAIKSLTLDYVAVRRAVLTFSTRTAVVGLSALASAATSAASGIGLVTLSLGNLGGALAIGGGAGLGALIQAFSVWHVALNGIGKALTTTGLEHEKAMKKLTKPARDFVGELRSMQGALRELKLLAQEGLFPGLTRGVQEAQKLMPVFRQSVYDTAQTLGYLGERAGEMAGRRGGELNRFFQRNIITMRRFGVATENVMAGFLDSFVAAEPLIGHVTSGIVTFSNTFKTKMSEWRKDGSLKDFFTELRKSWDNWTGIIGSFGKTLFNVWDAARPVIHKVENAIERTIKKAEKWTGSNKTSIRKWFRDSLGPLGSFVKLMGGVVKLVNDLGTKGNKNLVRIFDGLRTKFLPFLEKLFTNFNDKLLPNLIDLGGAVVDFLDASLPGLESFLGLIAPIAEFLRDALNFASGLVKAANELGSGAGMAATLLIGAGVIASWKTLRAEIGLTMLAVRRLFGFAPGATGIGKSMVQNFWPAQVARAGVRGVRGARHAPAHIGTLLDNRIEQRLVRNDPSPAAFERYFGYRDGRPTTFRAFETRQQILRSTHAVGRIPQNDPIFRGGGGTFIPPRLSRYFQGGYGIQPMRLRVTPGDPLFGGGRAGIAGNVPIITMVDPGRTGPLRRGASSLRGARSSSPYYAGQPLTSGDPLGGPRPLVGGQGAAMFKQYQQEMSKSTSKGVINGIKGAKGSALVGVVSDLATTVGIAFALPIVMKGISSLTNAASKSQIQSPLARRAGNLPIPQGSLNPAAARAGAIPFARELDAALKSNNIDKLKSLAHQYRDLADASKDLGRRKEMKALANDIGAVAIAADTKLLGKAIPSFETFEQRGDTSIKGIRDGLAVLQNDLGNKLPAKSRAYKEAMASSFGAAAAKVKAAMDAQLISQRAGMREMRKLLMAQFRTLGFSEERARHLAAGPDIAGKGGGNEGPAPIKDARGGFHIGRPGKAARDNVPMMINGKPVIAAEGEYVGVFNRHQKPTLDRAVQGLGYGSLEDFMGKNNRPHYMAGGGIIGLGRQLQRQGYIVGEHPAFGGVNIGAHVKGSLHGLGKALDVNADGFPGGEAAALDGLAKRLIAAGWHVLWKVAGHFDHLHVDTANGQGGGIGFKMPRVKAKGLGATPLVQALLDRARGGFKKFGENALMNFSGDIAGGGGGGNVANMQIARAMLATFGWDDNQWPSLKALGMGESGWDENAVNQSSGAFGIGQFLGKTKAAYAKFGATSHNAADQIRAMLQYIKDRYKTPAAAYRAWLSRNPHWYAQGGIDEAYAGLLDAVASASPPPRGETPPTPNLDDAITPGSRGGSKKPGKKKKKDKPKHIEPRPTGTGIGKGDFRPKGKKPKRPKLRPKVRRLITGPWDNPELAKIDPLTGERTSLLTRFYEAWGTKGERFITDLSILQGNQALSEEQAIVTDDAGNEVLNPHGMTVDGKFIPGIDQAVSELTEQLKYYKVINFADRRSENGGILGVYETQQGYAKGLMPFLRAGVQERRERLRKLKTIFEANVDLRREQFDKMKKMKNKGLTWQQAIKHNNRLITKWRRWKSLSDEDPAARRNADNEIFGLQDENDWLRNHKPKSLSESSPQFAKLLASYNQRGYENKRIVGDPDETRWGSFADNSAAGRMFDSLTFFTESRDFFKGELEPLRTSIATTKTEIGSIERSIEEWTGTKAPQLKPDTSAIDEALKSIGEAVIKHGWESINKGGVLASMQPLVDARLVGAFAHGGLVPETGYALVHKGEYINPAPDGPFRNGMNAPTNTPPVINVELVLRDRASGLVELVDARIDKRATTVTSRQQGMQSRILRASPGGN